MLVMIAKHVVQMLMIMQQPIIFPLRAHSKYLKNQKVRLHDENKINIAKHTHRKAQLLTHTYTELFTFALLFYLSLSFAFYPSPIERVVYYMVKHVKVVSVYGMVFLLFLFVNISIVVVVIVVVVVNNSK